MWEVPRLVQRCPVLQRHGATRCCIQSRGISSLCRRFRDFSHLLFDFFPQGRGAGGCSEPLWGGSSPHVLRVLWGPVIPTHGERKGLLWPHNFRRVRGGSLRGNRKMRGEQTTFIGPEHRLCTAELRKMRAKDGTWNGVPSIGMDRSLIRWFPARINTHGSLNGIPLSPCRADSRGLRRGNNWREGTCSHLRSRGSARSQQKSLLWERNIWCLLGLGY